MTYSPQASSRPASTLPNARSVAGLRPCHVIPRGSPDGTTPFLLIGGAYLHFTRITRED